MFTLIVEESMKQYKTEGMTCRSCVFHVTAAVQGVDPEADVAVDLKAQTVTVDSRADSEALVRALEDAGYPVLEVRSASAPASA